MKDIYTLNQFAEKVGVQPNTVRTWDKTNRLKPAFVTDGGHRRYTHEQVLKVMNKNSIQNERINIGYVRVSSKKQIDDLELQYQAMEQFLLAQGKPYRIIKNPALQELVQTSLDIKLIKFCYVQRPTGSLRF